MELTTFTTAQVYGIFAALSCAAVAGIIFYCIGLRTGKAAGYEQGRETAAKHCKSIVHPLREALAEHRDLLAARSREAMTLRANIRAEAEDHGKVERGLLNRLAAAAPLSDEDHAVLLAVANKLELAGDTFAGLNAHDHARFSRHLQAQVLDMAERIKKAQANSQPHPDSELIDWLDENATLHFDLETAELRFQAFAEDHPIIDDLRTLLRKAKADSDDLDRNHGELLQAAAAQEAAA
jgi:hypothetical protein